MPTIAASPETSLNSSIGLAPGEVLGIQNFLYKMAHGFVGSRKWASVDAKREMVEDLAQAGMIGALEAARTFDPGRGCKFITFAAPHARGRMLDLIDRECVLQKHISYESGRGPEDDSENLEDGLAIKTFMESRLAENEGSFHRNLQVEFLQKRLAAILPTMTPKDRKVFVHVHGLGRDAASIPTLAERWGIGSGALRARLDRAEECVRQALAQDGIRSSRDVLGVA